MLKVCNIKLSFDIWLVLYMYFILYSWQSPLQGFFSRKTDFHFHQFLSNFFKYSFSNLPLSYPYNIFVIYFPSNFPLLKSLSSTISNFFYLLISTFNLPSYSAITSFVFSKSFSLSQLSCSAINHFYLTNVMGHFGH